MIARLIKFVFSVALVVGAIGVGYVGARVWGEVKDLPDITLVERYEPIEAIQLFDKYDHLICTVEGDEDRRVVPLHQVSNHMQQAMLAAEDHHFYEHHGINFMSIIRAMMANAQAGHVVEGGSTITQQLVKNLFFTEGGHAGRTIDRKVKEAFLAYELESKYPKERILSMYLNQIYFGSNAYGIERAASRYFDTTAAQLDLAQSAFLAGLVKAPSELGSAANRVGGLKRQQEILDKMVEYGYITEIQAKFAKNEKLKFKKGTNPLQRYPYYVSYVLELLHGRFSQEELRKQGLKVYTNLDPVAQDLAEKQLAASIAKAPPGVSQGALVSVSVTDGAVIAIVGGVGNYWTHQFNRATNPHTAGSSFKPFVYLTAFLRNQLTPNSTIDDTPLVVHSPWGQEDYAPKNFDHRFLGRIPVRKALALSRNVCSVRITQLVGVDHVIETARQCGITTKLEPNLSLALGSDAVTPLEMAGAYATFPRGGVTIAPQVLRKIEDNRGQVIEVFDQKVDKTFAIEPIAELVSCMQDVVKFGTGTQARLEDRPVAGKTGTADEAKDIWFIGYTPDLCTAIWAGNDENKPIKGNHVTGGDVMAKIWREYNKAYYITHPTPPGAFIQPTTMQAVNTPKEEETPTTDSQEVMTYPEDNNNPEQPLSGEAKLLPSLTPSTAPEPGAKLPDTGPTPGIVTPPAADTSPAAQPQPLAPSLAPPVAPPAPRIPAPVTAPPIMMNITPSTGDKSSAPAAAAAPKRLYPYGNTSNYVPAWSSTSHSHTAGTTATTPAATGSGSDLDWTSIKSPGHGATSASATTPGSTTPDWATVKTGGQGTTP